MLLPIVWTCKTFFFANFPEYMRFECVTEHKEHKLNYPVVIKCSAIYDKERKERSGGLYINTFMHIIFLKSATLFRTPTAFFYK